MKNQVAFTYNDLGQVTKSEQAHEGVVGMGTRSVQYAFDTSASSSVFDDGARRMVIADYPAPDFRLDLFRGTAGTYAGLDRFARTIDQFWDGYGATADVDRFKYAYDYAGNRTFRDIDASIYATNNKDQAYAYDSLHRLITSDQGTLSGSTISGTPVREEDFTLDAMGNWSNYLTKTSGTTDLNQARTHNDANEITQIDASATHIAHDAAGNTTKAPKATSWSSHFDLIYDPWNRLVEVKDGANTVALYRYDGRNYRLTKAVYSGGVLSYTDHTYYNDAWQALEVRRETSGVEDADPREQFVWHPDYIDSLAMRYFDADTDGNLAESSDGPHYYAQDANFNVTAIVNATGTVLERYQYDPYGRLTVLDASFATDADGLSDIDNSVTYTGRLFDAEFARFYVRNRYYDPVTGRFLGRDPIGHRGGINLYEYCNDDPLNRTDPSGLIGVQAAIIAFVAAQGACIMSTGLYAFDQQANMGIGELTAHCYASCMIARNCGKIPSWIAGYVNEFADEMQRRFGWQNTGFDPRDIIANKEGRDIAGWETWVPFCGNLGRWFRQSCLDGCKSKKLDG